MVISNASRPAAPTPTNASTGRRHRFFGFDLEYSWRKLLAASALAFALAGASCSSSLQSPGADAGIDAALDTGIDVAVDVSATDASNDGSVCPSIQEEYAAALAVAQQCTVGTTGSCAVQVRASFWCNCTTFANSGADTLAAIATRYQASGCQSVCTGTCVQVQSLTCEADSTSPTGGRCKVAGVLNLDGSADGGEFSVPVGGELDILLQSIGPGSYSQQVMMSSDLMTVLEITIPAGPVNPAGETQLYRLRALSAGQVSLQIPFESGVPDAAPRSFTVTVDIR